MVFVFPNVRFIPYQNTVPGGCLIQGISRDIKIIKGMGFKIFKNILCCFSPVAECGQQKTKQQISRVVETFSNHLPL